VATASSIGLAEVCWRIIPLQTPCVWRRCPKCDKMCLFYSSDQFRLNARQRRVDVWLIYRCTLCDTTWNCTILTRCTPEEIGRERYQRFQQNDRDTAWAYAFDFALLNRLGVRVDTGGPVRVERIPPENPNLYSDGQRITLELPSPCAVRLDRLLASELQVSRSRLQRWFDLGFLHTWPKDTHALRKPIHHGQVITVLGGAYSRASPTTNNQAVAVVAEEP
jgi:hypothetical protein